MAVLDRILELLGTNRTRVQWKLRAWRRAWDRRVGTVKNRAQAVSYAHQACPRCTHPAGADEKVCTRCGEPLSGLIEQRVRRTFGFLWEPETPVVATVLTCAIASRYVVTLLWALWIAIIGLSAWRIDNAGHAGGFVPGLALGLLVRRRSDTGPIARRV